VNERLLLVRFRWGRIGATDPVFDDETGRFVCREVPNAGLIAVQQGQAQGEPCPPLPEPVSK
jgi:hypothetical protein